MSWKNLLPNSVSLIRIPRPNNRQSKIFGALKKSDEATTLVE